VPLSNFVTYTPAPQLAEISRVDQSRVFEVKADVARASSASMTTACVTMGFLRDTRIETSWAAHGFHRGRTAGRSTR
jgi:multidrug efflux pump subunit AcrB